MGVTGLWRLIEPSGKTVPLETLENKILAVDVSIWLHQAIKGFQDANGAPLPNAHLLGIYHRVCKLLYFRIKPIFVFDGGVPHLKKETISKRNQQKFKKLNEAEQIQKQLLSTLLKHSAVNQVLSESAKAKLISKVTVSKDITNNKTDDNLYKLPPLECDSTLSTEDEFSTSESTDSSPTKYWDLHTIDEKSSYFKSLPVDVKHDILTELKETRKQSSWGKIHELPKQSDDFATFQMKRLLKRYSVQASLEEVEKEMGGRSLSLAELEQLLNDQGVVTASDSLGNRIASDENTKYFLIKDIKKAMHEATIQKEKPMLTKIIETDENKEMVEEHTENVPVDSDTEKTLADKEYESDLQKAIQLSLQEVPSTSGNDLGYTRTQNPSYSFLGDITFHSESESEDDSNTHLNTNQVLMSAKNYMVEYSGLTPSEIDKIMGQNDSKKTNSKIDKNGPKNNTKISSCTKEIVSVSNKESTIDTNSKKEPEKKINESENIVTTTLSEPDEDKADAIELMSDSNSDVDDLLEVSDKITIDANTKLAKFEILIKPEDKLEDDIFSDIFSTIEKKEHTSNTNINDNNNKIEKTQEQSNIPETTISNREEVQVMETYTKRTQENLNNTEQSIKAKETTNELPESVSSTSSQGFIVEQNQVPKFTTTQLEEMEKQLFMEKEELMTEKFTKERMATNLTDEIYQEAQELLQLFGVPYIVAPMEAEAQCAYLNSINITQGTITDDSDIWLFGGKTVYKNFFDKQKHVMEFEMENIQQFFKLSREQLILLALLVGSDYTVGLQGIGPVTALEVLAAFPIPKTANKENYEALLKGLEQFRNWLLENKPVGLGRTVLKSKLKNVTVSNSFPSLQVLKAYLEPTIDSSEEPFSWAKPDINGLMQFARKKFGWLQTKSEEILKPVLKRLNDSRVQKSIREYFKTKHKIDSEEAVSKLSKRVKIAIKRIEKGPEAVDETVKPKEPRKRNLKRKKDQETRCVSKTKNDACDLSSDEDIKVLREAQERSEGMVQKHEKEVKEEIEARKKKSRTVSDIHKKEVIPQREQDKIDALRSKLKAIEVFRKSKKGPGFVPKRKISSRKPKDDAELSESSSD